jgi:hypothetical protein
MSLSAVDSDISDYDDEEVTTGRKSTYRLVRLADDDSAVSLPDTEPTWKDVLQRTIVSDEAFEIRGIRILDGVQAVRFLKFVVVSFMGIILVHGFVAVMKWERDTDYTLSDMVLYDSSYIILDITSFYVVGRLFQKKGVDHLSFLLISFLGATYMAAEFKFKFLRYSVSLFEMHCLWPWKLWLFVAILIPLVAYIVIKHVQYAVERQLLVVKLVELTLTMLFCLVPVVSDPNFHFHHWYAGWLLGMHANFDTWWSRATMAWCWGMYMQGIGVWGRDPILTCAYSYYISTDENCPYMNCYMKPTDDNSTTPSGYQPLERPDWRNCSGYIP